MRTANRWIIAIAGIFLQITLGAVYAWSVFRVPLSKQFGWSISQVTLTFTISIFVLGFASFFGGLWMNRQGPRVVALTAATLYVQQLIDPIDRMLSWLDELQVGSASLSYSSGSGLAIASIAAQVAFSSRAWIRSCC